MSQSESEAYNDADVLPVLDEQIVLPRSIITLTAQPDNPAGFTIGLALHSHQNTDQEADFRIPVVDLVALAAVNVLRKVPADFKAEIDAVNTALAKLTSDLQGDVSEEAATAAIAEFQATIGVNIYG